MKHAEERQNATEHEPYHPSPPINPLPIWNKSRDGDGDNVAKAPSNWPELDTQGNIWKSANSNMNALFKEKYFSKLKSLKY